MSNCSDHSEHPWKLRQIRERILAIEALDQVAKESLLSTQRHSKTRVRSQQSENLIFVICRTNE